MFSVCGKHTLPTNPKFILADIPLIFLPKFVCFFLFKKIFFSFDYHFVLIPQLIPIDFLPIKDEIYKFGKYLYTMRQQNAG